MRVLIIGAGHGARVYVPALLGISNVKEVLLASGHLGRVPLVSNNGARVVEDWQKTLENEDIAACAIVVPSYCQLTIARQVLDKGVPFLIEKPGGISPEEAAELLANSCFERVGVGYSLRFMRGLQEMLLKVQNGSLGKVRRISIQWITSGWLDPKRAWTWRCCELSGGGVLHEYATHCFDYIRFFTSSPVVSVFCSEASNTAERRDVLGKMRKVTASDTTDLLLRHADGCVTQICIMTSADREFGNRIEVHGTNGFTSWFHPSPFKPGEEQYHTALGTKSRLERICLPPDPKGTTDSRIPATRRMMESFLSSNDSVNEPMSMPVASLSDAQYALGIAKAAKESVAKSKIVSVSH